METERIEGMELVMDLIEGSERLNWMKAKIPEVIAMILGMVTPLIMGPIVCDSERGFRREIARSGKCVWTLWIDQGKIIVDCWMNPLSARDHKLAYTTREGTIHMESIEAVFQGLEDFARGMSEWLPVLEHRWYPIRMAAINARRGK